MKISTEKENFKEIILFIRKNNAYIKSPNNIT